MSRKRSRKHVTQRIAGPVDMKGGTRFPLSKHTTLDYTQGVHRLVFGEDSFFIVLYGAMNVGGLLGTEHNGIAVLWENKGEQLIMGHHRDDSYMKASDRQLVEYERICAMDVDEFKVFVNSHPEARRNVLVDAPAPILKPKLGYKNAGFTATSFDTAAAKVKFIESLIRFLCNHCDQDRFTPLIYDGLHQHLGHIAHYDRGGFYANWFADMGSRVRFFEHHAQYLAAGGWRDVSKALQLWIVSEEGQIVLAHYRGAKNEMPISVEVNHG